MTEAQPLLAVLPASLGTYFAEHIDKLEGAALARVNPIRYLHERNIAPRVSKRRCMCC